ncbi:hypothetical protein Emed_003614 [Eimeria media]
MNSDGDSAKKADEQEEEVERPVVSKDAIVRYMDQTELDHFLKQHNLTAAEYWEGVSFSIGEGGREFLRAALFHYTDGRTLQGASVPQLLKHAFVFPNKTLPIGLQGRVRLKLLIAKRMEEDSNKAASSLIEHGLDGVRLREATVAELLAVAWVLGLWPSVEEIVRGNEERKRSLIAQRASSMYAASSSPGTSSISAEESPESPCKRRCAQPQSSAENLGITPSSPCLASRGPPAVAANTEAEASTAIAAEASSPRAPVDRHSAEMNESTSRTSSPAHAHLQDLAVSSGGQGDIPGQPDAADLLANGTTTAEDAAATQFTHPGDSYRHLERIGQLVACANPAAPNAKAVAAEVVKELLTLVQKGVLPDPPEEILTQLQSAAVRLGVHGAQSHATQICGQLAEPAG